MTDDQRLTPADTAAVFGAIAQQRQSADTRVLRDVEPSWRLRRQFAALDRAAAAGRLIPCDHGRDACSYSSLWHPDRTTCGACIASIVPDSATAASWPCHRCQREGECGPDVPVGFSLAVTTRILVIYALCVECATNDNTRRPRPKRRRRHHS